MLAIYLCGAVLVAVGLVQMLVIQLVASAIRARALPAIPNPSSEDADAAETWDTRTLVAAGSR
jgi:hypothetical protein